MFRNPAFRQACFTWLTHLTSHPVADTSQLLDAHLLTDVTIQSDPQYFTDSSLVLPTRSNEPNLDALAQLAHLLLRYFEKELGKSITSRDYIPGVQSMVSSPFDDFWRLVSLVVSATLLSEQNGASKLYEELEEQTQEELQRGIGSMWGSGSVTSLRQLDDLGVSEVSRFSHGTVRLTPPPPPISSGMNSTSSINTTGTQQLVFESALSSMPRIQQQQDSLLFRQQSSVLGEPATLDIQNDAGDTQSLEEEEDSASRIGFESSETEDEPFSDSESYVSEFSQDLENYGGADAVTIGFIGPNPLAAYLFSINLLVYLSTGLYLLLTTKVPPHKSPYFKSYYDLTTVILQVLGVSVVSVILSHCWLQVLRHQTRRVIWVTTLAVPLVGMMICVWVGIQLFKLPGAETLVGYRIRNLLVLGISLVLSLRFIWNISQRRQDIERSSEIIRLACQVLLENQELYALSILVLAFYGVASVVTAIFASRLLLVDTHFWTTTTYMSLSFAWITAVFVQLLRFVTSSTVCQWYFHRHDPEEPPALHTLQASVLASLTSQFGTVVMSASLLFVTKTLHLVELLISWLMGLVSRIIPVGFIWGRRVYLVEGWNSYTLCYAAFTGQGFLESSNRVTSLLRDHRLLHSPVISLIKSTITSITLLLSLVLGYLLGTHAVNQLSLHSALVALVGSLIPFSLLQLVTHVMKCTVEALVVCYAVDLESDTCHSFQVVEAMAVI